MRRQRNREAGWHSPFQSGTAPARNNNNLDISDMSPIIVMHHYLNETAMCQHQIFTLRFIAHNFFFIHVFTIVHFVAICNCTFRSAINYYYLPKDDLSLDK